MGIPLNGNQPANERKGMPKESITAALRSASEQFSEKDLPISSELFSSLANRIETAISTAEGTDSDAARFKMLVNSIDDMARAVAKIEAVARGMELRLQPQDEDSAGA